MLINGESTENGIETIEIHFALALALKTRVTLGKIFNSLLLLEFHCCANFLELGRDFLRLFLRHGGLEHLWRLID